MPKHPSGSNVSPQRHAFRGPALVSSRYSKKSAPRTAQDMPADIDVPVSPLVCNPSSSQPKGHADLTLPTSLGPHPDGPVDTQPQLPAQPTSFMPAPTPSVVTACPTTRGPTPSQLDWDCKHGLILECKISHRLSRIGWFLPIGKPKSLYCKSSVVAPRSSSALRLS